MVSILAATLCCVLFLGTNRPYTVASFDVGAGTTIEVTRDSWCDQANVVYYCVIVNNVQVVPQTHMAIVSCDTDLSAESFEVLSTSDNRIIALCQKPYTTFLNRFPDWNLGESWTYVIVSDAIRILHDRRTNSSFPANTSAEAPMLRRLMARPSSSWELLRSKLVASIQILDVRERTIGKRDLDGIRDLTHLRQLYLDNTDTRDAHLPRLKTLSHLERLGLEGTNVTGKGIMGLEIETLRWMNIKGTKVNEADIENLKRRYPNVTIVHN